MFFIWKTFRATGIGLGIMSLALMPLASSVSAQEAYPTRDVKVIVPFAAGGGTDLVTRVFAQKLTKKYGKTFFVENRAGGGGGSVGGAALARSVPDGYTIGLVSISGAQTAAMDPEGFNPLRDLQPLARLGMTTIAVVVNPKKLPVKSLAELVAYAKSNPGLAYASAGVGSSNHFGPEMFAQKAGITLNHIPYRGEGPALSDVLAGQIPFMFSSLTQAKPHIMNGSLLALAVISNERSPILPDVPTLVESGYDVVLDAWYGFFTPKGTPPEIVAALTKDINEIRADPEVSGNLMEQLSYSTAGTDSPAEFSKYLESEIARYRSVGKLIGIIK
jgi:tripartite-type tricarboxylate transporter receptor subunit TctC